VCRLADSAAKGRYQPMMAPEGSEKQAAVVAAATRTATAKASIFLLLIIGGLADCIMVPMPV
jgi:hypothetical protein